jgi:hypothetical protein
VRFRSEHEEVFEEYDELKSYDLNERRKRARGHVPHGAGLEDIDVTIDELTTAIQRANERRGRVASLRLWPKPILRQYGHSDSLKDMVVKETKLHS